QGAFIRAMLREELRPGRADSMQRRVAAQVDRVADWWERHTRTPADRGRILCLVLLLQGAGTWSGLQSDADRAALRESLVAVMRAVVADYLASGPP
ncbi:MAG: hypothetical protein KC621_14670, partial [Myxococcales bacterium]|nr:hypothetical protein [Myxococcales bacterium]